MKGPICAHWGWQLSLTPHVRGNESRKCCQTASHLLFLESGSWRSWEFGVNLDKSLWCCHSQVPVTAPASVLVDAQEEEQSFYLSGEWRQGRRGRWGCVPFWHFSLVHSDPAPRQVGAIPLSKHPQIWQEMSLFLLLSFVCPFPLHTLETSHSCFVESLTSSMLLIFFQSTANRDEGEKLAFFWNPSL